MSRKPFNVDLCIIGAGAGGLSVAAGAAQLGRSVVIFEAGEMGGDCLNYGCVPSKALIAAAKQAYAFKNGAALGVAPATPELDFVKIMEHVQGVIAQIAPVDSQERFEDLGCIVIREKARFKDRQTVVSESTEVRAKRIIIATGSRAGVPPIPGLADIPYLTNETLFELKERPDHLLIIGAGPIGLELGQAFARLGSKVDIVDIAKPLPRHDQAHVDALIDVLKSEGVSFHAPAETEQVRQSGDGVEILLKDGTSLLKGSHILVAAGRNPSIEGLELETAGIDYNRRGVITDECLRTSNPKVFAVGDVSGRGGLTHAAGYHAGVIIKSFYFLPPLFNRWFGKAVPAAMPAVIYTQPELAVIGMSEDDARAAHADLRVVEWGFEHNDRALAERHIDGSVKIFATRSGHILGASILGEEAGELIHLVALAMTRSIKLSGLAQIISPYPTRSEAVKRAAGSFYTDAIFGTKARALAGFFTRFH